MPASGNTTLGTGMTSSTTRRGVVHRHVAARGEDDLLAPVEDEVEGEGVLAGDVGHRRVDEPRREAAGTWRTVNCVKVPMIPFFWLSSVMTRSARSRATKTGSLTPALQGTSPALRSRRRGLPLPGRAFRDRESPCRSCRP